MATDADLDSLITQFNKQLDITVASYADSKIKGDTVYEQNVGKLYEILGQIDLLQGNTSAEISRNDDIIQNMLSKLTATEETTLKEKDTYGTVKQHLDDVQSMYDKNKFVLLLKVAIVVFIFMKGNDIYTRNAYMFIGLITIFIAIFGISITLHT